MALLEQWDQHSHVLERQPAPDPYMRYNAPTEVTPVQDDIFSLQSVEFKTSGLKYLVVCSDILVMALENCHVIRLNLKSPEDLEDIDIARKPTDSIHKLFLDPTGNHLLIAMENEETSYLHSTWRKPKLLPRLKGVVIESVAWDLENMDPSTTRDILIGTSKGLIFETVLDSSEKQFVEKLVTGGKDQPLEMVYRINEEMPVTGLRFDKFPHTAPGEPRKYFIMATTPTRIYQFVGGPTFAAVFVNYASNPGFHELPGDIAHSELQFFAKYKGLAKSFAWLTGPGVYHGNLVFGSQNPGDSVTTDTELLPYPMESSQNKMLFPISLLVTEFHFLLLYPHKLQVISKLNEKVVQENNFSPSLLAKIGKMRGLACDPMVGTMWMYSDSSVWEIMSNNESRNVWELYLAKGQFDQALNYCPSPSQKDKVWTAQADYYFNKKNYELAATFYGKTQRPFEEVALRFIHINERDALKTYLLQKLKNIKAKEGTQMTIICTWLTEIFLNKLNQFKDSRDKNRAILVQEEFRQFLEEHKGHLDKATTFNLISSHGHIEELLFFAMLIQDYPRVISYYIQHNDYLSALQVMTRQTVPDDVWYKFSPVLMDHIPVETVNAWLAIPSLLPRKLLPALIQYKAPLTQENQAIKYLQHCVTKLKNKDAALHNYLLSLYVQLPDDRPLLAFLSAPEKYYDMKYALRLCSSAKKTRACVLIYEAMGMYEDAVRLALNLDLELAKINADKPEDDDSLRKKLWLLIAKHVIQEEKDIKKAMSFLKSCELLKIEDILPFFPDFVQIDDFKDEICTSLEEYNKHIDELKEEMEDATNSADLIRQDIKNHRNKYGFVGANQKCDICGYGVLTRNFYLFPCQHVIHADCLLDRMMKHLNSVQKQRVIELQSKIHSEIQPRRLATESGNEELNVVVSQADKLRAELDEYIASECIFCGDIMIKSVDEPFISPDERETIRSWEI